MKKLLFLLSIFCAHTANAQTYLISFAGTGESSSVSTVKAENIMSGASVNINGSDILRLNVLTGVNSIDDKQSSGLKIYPNPMTDNSTLEIFPPVAGNAVITVYEMTGKPIARIQSNLENVRQDYKISGVKNGLYIISIKGKNYQLSGILLSNSKSNVTIKIEKVNSIIQSVDGKTAKKDSKGTQAIVEMAYTTGDRLKLTGLSGVYSTTITDIPAGSKTITFNFMACTDGDNSNYAVVQIGTQIWMAENLKTTKYKDGTTSVPNVTENSAFTNLSTPAYCWYNNDEATYKATYGAIYNWYAVNTGNLCPTSWHVPSDAEWTTMENYLIANGLNYDGSTTGNKYAKALASATGWPSSTGTGFVGNTDYPAIRNASGFTALPGGQRSNHGLVFGSIGSAGFWWSSSEYTIMATAYYRNIGYDYNFVFIYGATKNTGFSVRCLQGEPKVLATLTTAVATNITTTNASIGGNITSDSGSPVLARGVCWGTTSNPTTANSRTTDGTGIGSFTSELTGLTTGTTYYVRAYATNSGGTAYGNEVTFITGTGVPVLTTTAITLITQTSATGGGNISNNGGVALLARGVCWGTSANPTIADNNTNDGTSTGIFTSSITGLTENTTYYVRAYATTSFGTSYGSQVSFATTGHSGTVTDFEGNIYKTITIGSQIWMAENLKTTKYDDGTAIPNITDNTAWAALTTGAYSDYLNIPANSTIYGRLYNWYAVDNNAATNVASNGGKNVCPTSWHVPTDTEWTTLTAYLGGENVAGGKLKEAGTTHWLSPNTGATNETGFTALPGGYRGYNSAFNYIESNGRWWSSTGVSTANAWHLYILNNYSDVYSNDFVFKHYGFTVRCLKDN